MFGVKKRRRRRRSELRLGVQAISYEATATGPALPIGAILGFWGQYGARSSGVLVLAGLVWAIYTLLVTPSFYVHGAEIEGDFALSAREIYSASGIDSQHVFWLNPSEVSARIEALPNIKSVEVSLTLPSQVVIKVVERKPQLLWQVQDTVWWVDQEGTIVPPKANVDGMLRIIDDDRQPVEVGYQIDPTIIRGAQALRILAPNVSVIRHTRAQGLIVATPEGWPVYLGDGSDMRAKLIVLSTLTVDLREKNIVPSYINLGNPLRPVYKELPVVRMAPVQQRVPAQPFAPQPARPLFSGP